MSLSSCWNARFCTTSPRARLEMPDGRPSLIWLEENLMGEFVDMEGPFEKTCTNKELYE